MKPTTARTGNGASSLRPFSTRPRRSRRRSTAPAVCVALAAALLASWGPAGPAAGDEGQGRDAGPVGVSSLEHREVSRLYGSARDLRRAAKRYRKLARRGEFVRLEEGTVLEEGATGDAVRALRRRLAWEGLDVDTDRPAFDADLREALMRWQRRNGLEVDGRLGPETRDALNVPPEQRAAQLLLNLERRAEPLPSLAGGVGILVNLPGQHLLALEDGVRPFGGPESPWMRVVVGGPGWETPLLREQLETIILNPYWNVPFTIVAAELLERLREGPEVLEEEDMEIVRGSGPEAEAVPWSAVDWKAVDADDPGTFPYLVRQRPGPSNPLGRVKFRMPNDEFIYLHDSPHDEAFEDPARDVSHGCVRLEAPLELAGVLAPLLEGDWSRSSLGRAMAAGDREVLRLERTVPVDFVYWTAWVDADGVPQFRRDIYDRDERALTRDRGQPSDPAARKESP